MKKLLLTFILGMFLLTFVSAESIGTFKQNQEIQITQYCSTADCTYANLTRIVFPNGTIENINEEMTKTGNNFNYSYLPLDLGTYTFTTCSNPNGVLVCEEDNFEVTPSGNSGAENIIFFVIIYILLYGLTLFLFFKKEIELAPFVALSGIALGLLGLYTTQNGIIIFRDYFTNILSYLSIGIGFGLGLWALIAWIQDSM
jgi:hypothetical protein